MPLDNLGLVLKVTLEKLTESETSFIAIFPLTQPCPISWASVTTAPSIASKIWLLFKLRYVIAVIGSDELSGI